jgi:tetratricopeptide (TPR) repeat protein
MKKFAAIIFFSTLTAALTLRAQLSAPAAGTFPSLTSAAPAAPAASAPAVPIPSDPAQAFAAGLAAYEKNDFPSARALFAAAESKATSAPLEYNFGNTCFQAGDQGAAVLHYLRALTLEPRDPDARQNLALARRSANLVISDPTRLDNFADLLTLNEWAGVATLAGWAALYLAILPGLYRWRGVAPKLLCATTALTALVAGVGYWGSHQHIHDGVILHADTAVQLSPTANSPAIGLVQSGEVAQTLDEHAGYFKVRTADGRLGWVEGAKYSPVWN